MFFGLVVERCKITENLTKHIYSKSNLVSVITHAIHSFGCNKDDR